MNNTKPDTTFAMSNSLLANLEWIDQTFTGTSRLVRAAAWTAKRFSCTITVTITSFIDSGNHACWGLLKLGFITSRWTIRVLSCGKCGRCANWLTMRDVKEHARQSALFLLVGVVSTLSLGAMAFTAAILCQRQYLNTVTIPLLFWGAVGLGLGGYTTSSDRLVNRYRKQGLIMSEADWQKKRAEEKKKQEDAKIQLTQQNGPAVQLQAANPPGHALQLQQVGGQPGGAIQLHRIDEEKKEKKESKEITG